MEFKDLQLLALYWVFLCRDFFVCLKNGCCQFRMLPRRLFSDPYSYGCVCEASLQPSQKYVDQAEMVLQRVLACYQKSSFTFSPDQLKRDNDFQLQGCCIRPAARDPLRRSGNLCVATFLHTLRVP